MAIEWLKAFNYFGKRLRSSCLTGIWICLCNIMILHSSNDHSIKPLLQPHPLATNHMNFVFRRLFVWLMQDKMMWGGIIYVVATVNRKKYFLSMKIHGLSDELPTLFSKYIFCNVATWTVWYDNVILSAANVHFKFFDIFWFEINVVFALYKKNNLILFRRTKYLIKISIYAWKEVTVSSRNFGIT